MILVIGYGSPLRGDDAVGQHIARHLERRLSDSVSVITAYQLTPELVEPVSRAQLAIFIDARMGNIPGALRVDPVEPKSGAGAFTHHVSPDTLLGAARELYGTSPRGLLISITGATFGFDSDLSPTIARMLPSLVDRVADIIQVNHVVFHQEDINHA